MIIHIFGSGSMASAIGDGLKSHHQVVYVIRNQKAYDDIKSRGDSVIFYEDIKEKQGLNIILGVKPYAYDDVSKYINNANFIISPMAKVDFATLKRAKAKKYCRIMPNLGAKIGASLTPYVFDDDKDEEIINLIKLLGKAVEVSSEQELDLAMVLSGCAPAYLALIAESLANAGLNIGLKNSTSYELVRGLFDSFAKTFLDESLHPAKLKENVCSPAGVSIKGIVELEKGGIRGLIYDAVSASAGKK